ncbi:MAG: hypothetical protein RI894_517 [Bacteroidota bacterium]|jgi:hypothetical protein
MSIQSETSALALQDILLGIADSLNQAQNHLRSLPPYDQYGRPNTMYQLPYLDFSLQVTSEFDTTTTTNSNGAQACYLRFRPVTTQTVTSDKNQIVSSISGRFVAVMPNEGMPQVILQYEKKRAVLNSTNTHYTVEVTVRLTNSANEKLSSSRIEFNFDSQESIKISSPITFSTPPSFSISEGLTDANGEIKTIISLPKAAYDNHFTFIFKINSGTIIRSIAISN